MNALDYWYPFYPSLFQSRTMHLTAEQEGIYRRIIDHYMMTRQPIKDDDAVLARISGVSIECMKHASSIIRAFFDAKEGLLFHEKCDEILLDQDNRSKKRTAIAKKAAKKRWSQAIDKEEENASSIALSMHEAMHNDATRQDKTRKEEKEDTSYLPKRKASEPEISSPGSLTINKPKSSKRGSRLPDDWTPGDEGYHYAQSKGLDHERIKTEFEKFRNYWGAKTGAGATKLDWLKTWKNWVITASERKTGTIPNGPIARQQEFDALRARERDEVLRRVDAMLGK